MFHYILRRLNHMINKNTSKKKLICLKTGAKGSIVNSYWKNDTAYVKVNLQVKFEDTYITVTKTFEEDNIDDHFSY
tara:strand:+ start:156 stop:383 length:228 start_codon:yes stop_codon:yes gene_type:complete